MTTPADLRYVYLPFVDVRKSTTRTDDGIEIPTRIVSGVMTDETLDLDGEIVDYDAAKKAATDWFRDWANVREQHSSNAIGTGIAMVADDVSRQIRTTIEVVDPLAIVKIDKGVLKGQSIGMRGGRKLVDAKAPKGRWVGFTQVEDSIVDRPSNPTAKFAVTKAAKDGGLEIGEALMIDDAEIQKIATAQQNKLAADKGSTSPLIGELVADVDGLNADNTNPASRQTPAKPGSDAGTDLDTNPGSALRRKKKPTPEIGGTPSENAATQTPKGAAKGYTPDSHGHLHTHDAGTDQEYSHTHQHDHVGGLHADGKPGDHQHDHWSKAAEADAKKDSIIPGQAQPDVSGAPGDAEDVTSPGGATAGACPDNSCSCGGCGPSCTGDCCEACAMDDDLDRRETMHFGANAEYLKFVEADIYKRDFSTADRKRLAGEGKALPDGSFPIANEEDLHNAIRAIGRASDPAAAKKHIKARAAAMGMSDALPADWKSKSANPDKTKALEEAIEAMYALVAPQIKAALEAGDTTKALSLLGDAEKLKGSIIAGQAGGNDDADGVEVVVDPATGKKKRTKPEQGGAGSANDAPNAEEITPTKAAMPDSMKALLSEVTKAAVEAAVKPLRDEIEVLKTRAQPGALLGGTKLLSAPKDVQAEMLKNQLGSLTIEQLEDYAENYPDGQIRMGFKQILADVRKAAGTES